MVLSEKVGEIWTLDGFKQLKTRVSKRGGKSPANRLKRVKKIGNEESTAQRVAKTSQDHGKPWLESLILFKIRFIFWIVSNTIKYF